MKDGFVLFYVKDDKIHPVGITHEELSDLQEVIPCIIKQPIKILEESCGRIYNMNTKEKDGG